MNTKAAPTPDDNDDDKPSDNLPAIPETPNLPAVAPTVGQVLSALSDPEWADVDAGHDGAPMVTRLPRLKLNRKMGQPESGFIDELTGEKRNDITFVWLADTVTQAWWKEGFGKGSEKPECRSRDGITPDPDSPDRQSETCAKCPLGTFEAREAFKADEKNNPRPCNRAVEVLAYLVHEKRLAIIRFGGMAYTRVTRYLGAIEKASVPSRPPMAYVTFCELEGVDTDNGMFLVPRFEAIGDIPRAQAGSLIEARNEKRAEWRAQIAEDLAEGRTGEDHDSNGGGGPFDATPSGGSMTGATGSDREPF
jgi:hypothetical protein